MARPRHRAGAILAVPVLALILGTAACSGQETNGGVATAGRTTPTAPASRAAADSRAYTQCMRDNGVDIADADPGDGRVPIGGPQLDKNDPAVRRAVQTCQSLAPPDGRDRSPLSPTELQQAVQLARCLREHGLTVADPDPDDVSGPRVQGSVSDRELAAAWGACRDKAPPRWSDL